MPKRTHRPPYPPRKRRRRKCRDAQRSARTPSAGMLNRRQEHRPTRESEVNDRRGIRERSRFGLAALALAATAPACVAADDDANAEPSTTPYRPSVSTPAALSAPGWLEIEAGFEHDHAGAGMRDSVPATFKLAFSPDWGV